ncbi:hypothetical protein V6R21_02395, partial [Limibacter armeniacum]
MRNILNHRICQQADRLLMDKPYIDTYKELYIAGLVGRYLFPLASIATGCYFLADALSSSLPFWLSLCMAISLVTL